MRLIDADALEASLEGTEGFICSTTRQTSTAAPIFPKNQAQIQ